MVDALVKMYRYEGIRGLYKGFVPGIFGVSHGALQFMAYEEMKNRYNNYRNLPIDTKLVSFSDLDDKKRRFSNQSNFLNPGYSWVPFVCCAVKVVRRDCYLSVSSSEGPLTGPVPRLQRRHGCYFSDVEVWRSPRVLQRPLALHGPRHAQYLFGLPHLRNVHRRPVIPIYLTKFLTTAQNRLLLNYVVCVQLLFHRGISSYNSCTYLRKQKERISLPSRFEIVLFFKEG